MKKLKLTLILFLVVAGSSLFTSCDKADTSSPKGMLMNNEWKLTGFETGDETFSEVFEAMFMLVDATYEFKKNGVYTVTTRVFFASESENGTWSISDDGTELTLDGEVSEIKELTKDVLRLGPNKGIMGDYAEEDDEELDSFVDYSIVFQAK